LERFVREVADECLISQRDRSIKYEYFKNYFLFGSDDPASAAIYNKTFAYLDDLESLLYSPLSLRFRISNPLLPNVLEEAKGRATSNYLRSMSKSSDTDTRISEAVLWSLIKGKTFIKGTYKRGQIVSDLVQPEDMGVLRENHNKLDEDMEAFTQTMYITPYQFERMIWNHPDKNLLRKRANRYAAGQRPTTGGRMTVTTGGMQPFQAGGAQNMSPPQRGMVDWMTTPAPILAASLENRLLRLDEVWIWDDKRRDWATFQLIGDDILIMGKYSIFNALAHNPETMQPNDALVGHHPYTEFSPNRIDQYFWGRSEIVNIALLQEAINSRINGTNRLLRLQEDPPKQFSGSSGVNQQALARFNTPGGYWTDSNPQAQVKPMAPEIPESLWGSLHEYERMFDEMGGLPPIARGRGEAGVRSQGHAETLVRMFSPRFKDRALLIERDVSALGTLILNLARAHVGSKLVAWVPEKQAGMEGEPANPLIVPPAEGLVAVPFLIADLSDDVTLSVDSHSSSPAFSADAKNLMFDLFKIHAASAEDVIEHTDAPDPEGMISGIMRREIAAAKAQEAENAATAAGKAVKH
jgi:hypothetical protein